MTCLELQTVCMMSLPCGGGDGCAGSLLLRMEQRLRELSGRVSQFGNWVSTVTLSKLIVISESVWQLSLHCDSIKAYCNQWVSLAVESPLWLYQSLLWSVSQFGSWVSTVTLSKLIVISESVWQLSLQCDSIKAYWNQWVSLAVESPLWLYQAYCNQWVSLAVVSPLTLSS